MGRPKKEYPPEVLKALTEDWVGSTLSPGELEKKHGIPRSSIRDMLEGVVEREGGEKKRAIMRAAAAGIKEGMDPAMLDATVRKEAGRDIEALGVAAANSRGILDEVAGALDRLAKPLPENASAPETLERIQLRSPRSLLQLSQANAHALEAWRRARELDAPDQAPRVARVTVVDP